MTDGKNPDIFTTKFGSMKSNNCISNEIATSTDRAERMSGLMILTICIGCTGVLLIFLHIIISIRVHNRRPFNSIYWLTVA